MRKHDNVVALSGYYGFDNIGDEAILYSILQSIQEIDRDIKPVVLSNNPQKTSKLYGVEAVDRWKPHEVVSCLLRSKLLISGGGSLLQDVTGLRSLSYYLGVIGLAKTLRRKVVYYAQGIGPVNTLLGKKLVRFVTDKVDLVTVRDEASKEFLKEIGVKKPPLQVTVDPVLALSREKISLGKGWEILNKYGVSAGTPVVGISVRDWQGLKDYKVILASAADYLISLGYQVFFIPFHFPADISACRDIMRLMKKKAYFLKKNVTVEEMLSLVGSLEIMLGMRLHSLIMAAVMSVPMIGISYDPKVDNFLKMVSQPNAGRVQTLTEEGLRKNLEKVSANLNEFRKDLQNDVDKLRQKAKENIIEVLKVM